LLLTDTSRLRNQKVLLFNCCSQNGPKLLSLLQLDNM
jgi:hypothetical protein